VLLTIALVQRPRLTTAFVCGAVLAVTALTRSSLWPLPLVLCPLLAFLIQGKASRRVLVPVLLLAGYVAVIAPWALRNTRLQETLTIVDTMGGINLRMGNYEFTPDDRMWDAVAITGERSWVHGFTTDPPGLPATEGRKEKWAQRKAVEYMVAHPIVTARRSLIKFADFWGLEREFAAGVQARLFAPPRWAAILGTIVILLGYVAVVTMGASGIWLAPPADWRLHVVVLLPVLVTMGAHTLVFGHARYHLPLMPIFGIYAAALITRFDPSVVRRVAPSTLGALASVAILATIWVRQIVFVDLGRITSLLKMFG